MPIDDEPLTCDVCGESEPEVLFSNLSDVCDGCYEEHFEENEEWSN